ncbi:MAG: SIS domain-containing protein [Deltaproteobacteria bacterium]|nr:SIS domain-containing protein [Deltaproteobacteria bacterium]
MCGVIGLLYESPQPHLGRVASDLLRTLEYRGYDSTGGAIQGEGEEVDLRKGVGAPSVLVESLGIIRKSGQVFAGQVRWATFGAVDETNAQPHVVRCKRYLYGAHNGNVTNSDPLKAWLQEEGHRVLSDNDGEMVVHTIEHFFALGMESAISATGDASVERDPAVRRQTMRNAIARASALKLVGSFAAVMCDPVTRTVWAIKRGSSLYVGVGEDGEAVQGGRFGIASSDLSSVLKLTRAVVPIVEGEFVEMRPDAEFGVAIDAYGIRRDGEDAFAVALEREPSRSRLRAADIALMPPFETFMEQEIAAQEGTVAAVVDLFAGGSAAARGLAPAIDRLGRGKLERLATEWDALRDEVDDSRLRERLAALLADPTARDLGAAMRGVEHEVGRGDGFFGEVSAICRDEVALHTTRALAALDERLDATTWLAAADAFVEAARQTAASGRTVHVICCGSSYHAARAGAMFWNELAGIPLRCSLPGEFRGEQQSALRDGDLVVAVSQSGETKDLIDILNDIITSGLQIRRVALVNNINSTLAQEKAEIVLPLRCGPEIAVPATKSFMNQLAVFYGLACRLGRAVGADAARLDDAESRFVALPALLRATVAETAEAVEEAARLLYLRPSVHILATRMWAVAKEGALKIREVVLNHTEGYEASEFKHGPNTILGRNTLYGPEQIAALLRAIGERIEAAGAGADDAELDARGALQLARAVVDRALHAEADFAVQGRARALLDEVADRGAMLEGLDADYPLIYSTGPDARDVALTISQINTHKIRRSMSILIAEPNAALRQAIGKPPADNPNYRSVYLELPRTEDTLMVVFTSTIVLQRLALRMSEQKAAWLDRVGVREHGVHPDVPKNVSKSITVD